MSKIKDILSVIVGYAKERRFHFFVLCGFCALFFVESIQFTMIKVNEFNTKVSEVTASERSDDVFAKLVMLNSSTENSIYKDTANRLDAIGAKLDIMDSTIEPDQKRRVLIKTVREAIASNSREANNIRTLNRIAIAIVDNSYKYNLSIASVLAQMKQESGFKVRAASHAGAKGLMQIIDPTADEIAHELGRSRYNIWHIETNVEFGCHYMAKMLNVFENDFIDALRGYNFGPHNVKKVKSGQVDYSRSIVSERAGVEIHVLIDKRGKILLDDNDNVIIVREEHMYPLETIGYIENIIKNRAIFSEYGLDKIE